MKPAYQDRMDRLRDMGAPEGKKQRPAAANSIAGNYDRDAYLSILSPETRERLLSIRETK
jgi:hypothetical protein